MKLISALILIMTLLLTLSASVSAIYQPASYGYNGQYSNPYRYTSYSQPYNERTNFYANGYLSRDAFTSDNQFSTVTRDLFSQSNLFSSQNDLFTSAGYTDQAFQNLFETNNLNVNQASSIDKRPCSTVTRVIDANFDGKDNDFRITGTEKRCDGIRFTQTQNNRLANSFSNNAGFNTNAYGTDTSRNTASSQGNTNRNTDAFTSQTSSAQQNSQRLETNFGKGSYILLN